MNHHPVASPDHLQKLADESDLFHVVCMVSPPTRPIEPFIKGVRKICTQTKLKPVMVHSIYWEGMLYNVLTIPLSAKGIAELVAARLKLSLLDGIPTVLDRDGQRWFPMSSKRVWKLN